MQSLCRRVYDLHVPSTAPLALNLSSSSREELGFSSAALQSLSDPFKACADATFDAMHQDSWSRFVKLRLTLAQKANVTAGTPNNDSFCLTGEGEVLEAL